MNKTILTILLVTVLLLVAAPNALADDPDNPLQGDAPSNQDITKAEAKVSVDGSVVQVDPATVTCDTVADFEDVAGGTGTGTNYDGILVSGGLQLAERFAGQSLSYSGNFDVLSGTPSDPLTLQTGNVNENLNVSVYGIGQIVTGLGPLGYPDLDAIGEGSLAILFPIPQSQFKFLIEGVDGGGSATLNFFKADGSSLGTIIIDPANQTYGFRHSLGIREIAGFSIHNTDPAGIGYDNICYESLTEVHIDIKPGSCPNPFNGKSQGSVPVAILGNAGFDVTTVDLDTVRLEGVPIMPKHVGLEDVSAPVGDPEDCYNCFDEQVDCKDGYLDLVVKFDTQELAAAIGPAPRDACVVLTLTGLTLSGEPFEASDSMVIKTKIKD